MSSSLSRQDGVEMGIHGEGGGSIDMRKEINATLDKEEKWQKMGTEYSFTSAATEYVDRMVSRVTGGFGDDEEVIKILFLAITLFFVVGGYWLLRTLKDPIMSSIDGVSCSQLHVYLSDHCSLLNLHDMSTYSYSLTLF